jgi:hypothetical protein
VTTIFRQCDGRALHVGKATGAEPEKRAIYRALGANQGIGGTRKLIGSRNIARFCVVRDSFALQAVDGENASS